MRTARRLQFPPRGTGKKTPGGVGTHTGHTGAHGHTDHTETDEPHNHPNPTTHTAWHAEARVEGCIDRTVYGASRTATTSFFTHHLRLISLAAVIGAALPVAIWAKSRKSHLLSGL